MVSFKAGRLCHYNKHSPKKTEYQSGNMPISGGVSTEVLRQTLLHMQFLDQTLGGNTPVFLGS